MKKLFLLAIIAIGSIGLKTPAVAETETAASGNVQAEFFYLAVRSRYHV
ncbi:MAG: hypothetical protein RIM23_10645 [Coleofasciculus sp. G3-WIS-01]